MQEQSTKQQQQYKNVKGLSIVIILTRDSLGHITL